MRIEGRTIAVTGATGFVGSHIALTLLGAGARVRGVVRSPQKGAWLEKQGIELVRADLLEPDALAEAFSGCDAVVANAALGGHSDDLDAYERVNQQGTDNTLRATAAAGVRRFVQISTVAVYRTRLYRAMAEDHTPYDPDQRRWQVSDLTTNWRYARTKTRAERMVWKTGDELDLQVTALRPGPVYGSRDPKLTARYLARLERRVVFAPTVGVPHVHAGDVGQAVVASLNHDASIGRAYNISGPPVSPYQVMKVLSRLTNGPPVVPVPVPAWVAFDVSAAARDLAFTPRDLEQGLAEVIRNR